MDSCDFLKMHRLACLENTTSIDETVAEVRELMSLVYSAQIPDNYSVWTGVRGSKRRNGDSVELWDGARMTRLASQNADGFVLTTKVM